MTLTEFDQWRDYHGGAFAGLQRWLTKLDKVPGNQLKTLEAWYRSLSGFTLEDAKRATDAMNLGEAVAPVFGEHARAVKRLCESYVRRRTTTPSTTYRPPASSMPSLHADYSQQLDAWLAMPAAEQRQLANRHYSSDFERKMVLRHDRCLRCDRDHGHDFFLMGMFDLMVGVPQPAAEVSE